MSHNFTFMCNLEMMNLWEQRAELWLLGLNAGLNNGEMIGLTI